MTDTAVGGPPTPTPPPLTCRKCGSDGIGTAWHANGFACTFQQRERHPSSASLGEHLHRTCLTCGFDWTDATLDGGKP